MYCRGLYYYENLHIWRIRIIYSYMCINRHVREKEKQKENRFDRSVDGDVELSDKDSYQQYACYNSQAELSDFDFSNPKAHKKGQEDSQLGVYLS